MNTLNMSISELVKYRNEISQKFFNRPEQELNSKEIIFLDKYIDDHNHPQWKQVILNGKRTIYSVSNTGLVMNSKTNYILKANKSRKGYLLVGIENHSCKVHRLVAEAFIPNPENKPQVNHINGDKECNWVGNLEWSTCRENIHHAINHKLFYVGLGEKANSAVYTDEQVHQVCKLLETQKFTNVEIAKLTGVDAYTVSKIKCKEEWNHISNNYNIPKPIQNAKGSAAAASKYTDKQIHEVCKKLKEGISMATIARETGVGYDMIFRIKKGLNWSHISSQYGIIK